MLIVCSVEADKLNFLIKLSSLAFLSNFLHFRSKFREENMAESIAINVLVNNENPEPNVETIEETSFINPIDEQRYVLYRVFENSDINV